MKKGLIYGIMASFFFAFTFILNRSMNLSGGFWGWSASLRYVFMLPMLWLLVKREGSHAMVIEAVKKKPVEWILWSTVGFGLFYAPLTFASAYGESWLIAACWQITIVAGVLLTPLFGHKMPVKNVCMAMVVLVGVFLLQFGQTESRHLEHVALTILPILIAAFSYPLGNRKMMQICPEGMTTIQRVYGMTLCSMPFWVLLVIYSALRAGVPGTGQVLQSVGVALFSGVIATILFFRATDMVRENPTHLAVVEATQSGEVIFTLLGGILVLGDALPSMTGIIGLVLIIAGMILNSLIVPSA